MPVLLLALHLLSAPPSDKCDDVRVRSGVALSGHRSTQIRDDDERGRLSVRIVTPERCREATMQGRVRFTDDDRSVASLADGAEATFREKIPGSDRAVRFTGIRGGMEVSARRDGRVVPWDAEMQGWLATFLPGVLRELGVDAPRRVARLMNEGGVPRVLDMIATIESSGGRRAHYEPLLARPLAPGDVERIVRRLPSDIRSSGDLAELLRAVPMARLEGRSARVALQSAIERIPSSGDRTATLRHFARVGDRETLLLLAQSARGIPSSGDKSEFLRESAVRYLDGRDAALRDAWFDAAVTVPSSGDLSELLRDAVRYGKADAEVTRRIIGSAARHVASSGDRSEVLLTVITSRLVTTPALREALRDAARGLPSNGDHRRVMDALLAQEG